MTNDSKLFPPRPRWEEQGYRPDEYSRWLKGGWLARTPDCPAPLGAKRTDIPQGIILSRDGEAWIAERAIENTALPVYSAKVFNLFDFSSQGWLRGKGRGAVWGPIDFPKRIQPEYLMSTDTYLEEKADPPPWLARLLFKDISTAVHQRTMLCAIVPPMPAVHASPSLQTLFAPNIFSLQSQLGSFVLDFVARLRIGYLHLSYFVIEEMPLLAPLSIAEQINRNLAHLTIQMSATHELFSPLWIFMNKPGQSAAWRRSWASTLHERLRLNCILDAILGILFRLVADDLHFILRECDHPVHAITEHSKSDDLAAKGFWRVDKDKDPELRHTVLTLVAFHDLQQKIAECGGDRNKGIEAFCTQNDGEGWMLPETLRLADYGLGHDERAREHQPVASRLGPRFYDWQLEQNAEESWCECHLHARNLLGEAGYRELGTSINL